MRMKTLAVLVSVLLGVLYQVEATAQRPQEAIKVHGHWVIDIRAADGRLVTHTEFDNALAQGGVDKLSRFLAHVKKPGLWNIWLLSSGNSQLCDSGSGPSECRITESQEQHPDRPRQYFPSLYIDYSGLNVVLHGTATASFSGTIDRVRTMLTECDYEVATADLNARCSSRDEFSGTVLSTPVSVQQDQIVQITVTISFS
jgi:hypothetical protein